MPFWTVDLNLKEYEPTKLTDLTFSLILQASKEQGGKLKKEDLIGEKIGLEQLKRFKQLRGTAQFFGIEIKDADDAPLLYRKIQKEFEKQKVKVPALDLDFLALSGMWIISVVTVILGISLKNQVSFIEPSEVEALRDPWIVFDADSKISRALSTSWLMALALSPVVVAGSLVYLNYSSAWIDGFAGGWFGYLASATGIALIAVIGCWEIWAAALLLWKMRANYWSTKTSHHRDAASVDPSQGEVEGCGKVQVEEVKPKKSEQPSFSGPSI